MNEEPEEQTSGTAVGLPARVAFLPGNGHHPVRLEAVRQHALRGGESIRWIEILYPTDATFEALTGELARRLSSTEDMPDLVYATGIGGLVVLAMRAEGALLDVPVVLQGPVLWGLERRWFPRLMRLPGGPRLLVALFQTRGFQKRFRRRYFEGEQTEEWWQRFFSGYHDARAFAAWFRRLTPALLRRLERELAARPGALDNLEVWWGERDAVVGLEELRVTERALGKELPLRTFASWGHYPMVDDPEGWLAEVQGALARAGSLS